MHLTQIQRRIRHYFNTTLIKVTKRLCLLWKYYIRSFINKNKAICKHPFRYTFVCHFLARKPFHVVSSIQLLYYKFPQIFFHSVSFFTFRMSVLKCNYLNAKIIK